MDEVGEPGAEDDGKEDDVVVDGPGVVVAEGGGGAGGPADLIVPEPGFPGGGVGVTVDGEAPEGGESESEEGGKKMGKEPSFAGGPPALRQVGVEG